jgi:hypothetical protein
MQWIEATETEKSENGRRLKVIGGKQVYAGWSTADVELLAQSAVDGVAAALGIAWAKREIAHRALARARKEARQGDSTVDGLMRALEVVLTLDQPADSAAAGVGRFADGCDNGWKKALDRARDVIALKLHELPKDAKPTERALLQVFDELSRAGATGYQAYKVPEKLDRYKPRRQRPEVQPRELETRREVILAALPKAGDRAKRSDITRLLVEKRMATSASSASNAIKELILEGVLVEHRLPGGRLLVRKRAQER